MSKKLVEALQILSDRVTRIALLSDSRVQCNLLLDIASELRSNADVAIDVGRCAERYRYLRCNKNMAGYPKPLFNPYETGDEMDGAIDAAMAGANTEAKPTREAGSA